MSGVRESLHGAAGAARCCNASAPAAARRGWTAHARSVAQNKAGLQRPPLTEAVRSRPPLDDKARSGHDFSRVRVNRTLNSLPAKLIVGAIDDPLEREADRVAEQVVATPFPLVVSGAGPRHPARPGSTGQRRGCGAVQRGAGYRGARPSMEPALRQDLEQRIGHDFSRVRVRSGVSAEQSALDVNAHAYTVGHDIVFGRRPIRPGDARGPAVARAHELTHVVQQGSASRVQREPAKKPDPTHPDSKADCLPWPTKLAHHGVSSNKTKNGDVAIAYKLGVNAGRFLRNAKKGCCLAAIPSHRPVANGRRARGDVGDGCGRQLFPAF